MKCLVKRVFAFLGISAIDRKQITKFDFILSFVSMLLFAGLIISILHMLAMYIEGSNTNQPINMPEFKKIPETDHVNCARILRGDNEYIQEIAKNRPRLSKHARTMTCDEIRRKVLPARNPNTLHPVLHVRLVYMDYEFIEEQLATTYASENVYCYSIDKKAPEIFKERIRKLAECLPNVVVVKKELEMDSAGHNQNEAHLDCIKEVRDRKWEYAILLQNHDILIKTHGEITEILKIYGDMTEDELMRCNSSDIHWGKGAIQAIISREAADFIVTKINVTSLINQMNAMGYGVDEQLYQSLQVSEEINLPGRFTSKCLTRGSQSSIRMTTSHPTYYGLEKLWNPISRVINGENKNDCPSGRVRHATCMYGVEDFTRLAASKTIIANKVWPEFDAAIIACVSELLYNRTKRGAPEIVREYYENLNMVRYHRERQNPEFDINAFECEK